MACGGAGIRQGWRIGVWEGVVGRSKLLFARYFLSSAGYRRGSRSALCLCLAASLSVAALTGTGSTLAQSLGDTEVKARPAARGYHNLREAMDLELQRQLRRSIRELDLDDAIEDKQLSLALVDVTEPMHPRLAMINGDEMVYAASLPKIAILFGAFQKIHEGRLRLDDDLHRQMVDMIRVSSNEAATYVLNKVGRGYLANLLQSRHYRLYDASYNGGLWVGKAYASGSAYQRDPLHNISHGATAYQVARFYYLLETGRLVSPEASRQMKAIMSNPGIHHKFVKGLEETRPDARIYRKSGTWREFHADSAIVERAGRRYIAVALAEHRKGGEWMQKLIVAMDDIVFSHPRPIQSASLN
jgi:beta-lactamase class A